MLQAITASSGGGGSRTAPTCNPVYVLNKHIRPFTAKWYRLAIAGAFADPARCREFREELEALQQKLRDYTGLLADVAGVEDLTRLEMQS